MSEKNIKISEKYQQCNKNDQNYKQMIKISTKIIKMLAKMSAKNIKISTKTSKFHPFQQKIWTKWGGVVKCRMQPSRTPLWRIGIK